MQFRQLPGANASNPVFRQKQNYFTNSSNYKYSLNALFCIHWTISLESVCLFPTKEGKREYRKTLRTLATVRLCKTAL